jgi:serine/threonine protein kinase
MDYIADRSSNILEGLKHRNIVQLVQKIKDPKNERIYIVMEVCYPPIQQ